MTQIIPLLILSIAVFSANSADASYQPVFARQSREVKVAPPIKQVTANPSYVSNHGGEVVVFSGLDPLTPDQGVPKIFCTFGVYDGSNSVHNRISQGSMVDANNLDSVQCVAPVLLDDTGLTNVIIEVTPGDGSESKTYSSILYIVHNPNRPNVLKVKYNEDGDMIVDWDPKYFAPLPADKQQLRVYELFMRFEKDRLEAVNLGTFFRGEPSVQNEIADNDFTPIDATRSGTASIGPHRWEPSLWFGVLAEGSETDEESADPGNWEEDKNKKAVVSELSKTSETLRTLFTSDEKWQVNSNNNGRSKRGVDVFQAPGTEQEQLFNGKSYDWLLQWQGCRQELRRTGTCPSDMPGLPACPPVSATAKVDGRFSEYPADLKEDTTQAHVCYVSSPVTSGPVGRPASRQRAYAQLCCYNSAGHLLCGGPHGGTALIQHTKNAARHIVRDVRPRKTCCKDTKYDPEICGQFFKCRRYNCGEGYTAAKVGNSWGDPHYTTFDGLKYDFQGIGEYWLVKTKDVAVQARQIQASNPWATSVALFHGMVMICHGERFQIQLDTHDKGSLPVSLHYNGQPYPIMKGVPCVDLGTHGMTACVTTSTGNPEVSVKVTCDGLVAEAKVIAYKSPPVLNKYIDINVYFDRNHLGGHMNVTGLMGNNNGDVKDDYILPDETKPVLPHTASWADVHEKFGEHWRVDEYESAFAYLPGKSYHTYNNVPKKFKPALEKPNPANYPKEVQAVCKDNLDCYVEYKQSGSMEIASVAVAVAEKMEEIKEDMNKPSPYCPRLSAVENGYYKPEKEMVEVGGQVSVHCNEGFTLVGMETIKCPEDRIWPRMPPAICAPRVTANPTVIDKEEVIKEPEFVTQRPDVPTEPKLPNPGENGTRMDFLRWLACVVRAC